MGGGAGAGGAGPPRSRPVSAASASESEPDVNWSGLVAREHSDTGSEHFETPDGSESDGGDGDAPPSPFDDAKLYEDL